MQAQEGPIYSDEEPAPTVELSDSVVSSEVLAQGQVTLPSVTVPSSAPTVTVSGGKNRSSSVPPKVAISVASEVPTSLANDSSTGKRELALDRL